MAGVSRRTRFRTHPAREDEVARRVRKKKCSSRARHLHHAAAGRIAHISENVFMYIGKYRPRVRSLGCVCLFLGAVCEEVCARVCACECEREDESLWWKY